MSYERRLYIHVTDFKRWLDSQDKDGNTFLSSLAPGATLLKLEEFLVKAAEQGRGAGSGAQ